MVDLLVLVDLLEVVEEVVVVAGEGVQVTGPPLPILTILDARAVLPRRYG